MSLHIQRCSSKKPSISARDGRCVFHSTILVFAQVLLRKQTREEAQVVVRVALKGLDRREVCKPAGDVAVGRILAANELADFLNPRDRFPEPGLLS